MNICKFYWTTLIKEFDRSNDGWVEKWIGKCGIKKRRECSCGGDRLRCDFYKPGKED